MKLLLEIKDEKAAMFMELLKELRFVKKATPVSDTKSDLLQEIQEAVNEMKLIKQGKLEGRNVEDLIDEL